MNKMILAAVVFVFMVMLSVFMHQQNDMRFVSLTPIVWKENRPILVDQDSVNKLLKVVLSDSAYASKSGINLRNIEHTLNQNVWVENAQSFMYIDGGVGVHLTSKLPIVRVQGDSSYYLDGSGQPFPLSTHQSVVVPIFYGNPNDYQRRMLIDAVQKTNQDSFMSNHVVAYEWLSEGLAMEPRNQEYQIVLGVPNELKQKFKKYKAFYAMMQDSTVLKTYKKVNLSFHGQVVCSK